MKKILFSVLVLLSIFTSSYSQSIGILGTALGGYNVPDTDMVSVNNYEYVLENLIVSSGTLKFRQDNDWAINWGSTAFPTGTGVQNGAEIPIPAGTYNVEFNRPTGTYTFFAHANIGMIGTAVSATGFTGDDVNLSTIDGTVFSLYYTFSTGDLKFRQDDAWAINWGSSTFPTGTATQNGANIHVQAGTYLITFNATTHEYSFSGTPSYPGIGIIGTAVSASGYTGEDTKLSTNDGITYTLLDYTFTAGTAKFRQDNTWAISWGGTHFPYGTGILNGTDNIPITAGTYTVTFNRSNGTYTFIPSVFPVISIWGPAVNSQLGYAGSGINMSTADGITYTLSGYYFSSGNAYFRQDNNSSLIWGSYTFPTGIATPQGPTIFIPSGEYFVTFNRNTGAYSFSTPSIGILGTALNGYNVPDTDLNTTDGFNYSISNLVLKDGLVKFRKDNLWTSNWGGSAFPTGTGTQDGVDIPVTAGTYNITFDRTYGHYNFQNTLSNKEFEKTNFKVYPNPTQNYWNFSSLNEDIETIQIITVSGKNILAVSPKNRTTVLDVSNLTKGIYFAKITTDSKTETLKLVKE